MYTKEDLRKAYYAGQQSIETNNDIDKLLEQGTKQSPAKSDFSQWFENTYEENQFKSYSNKNGGWIEPRENIG